MPSFSPIVISVIFGLYLFLMIILLQYIIFGRKDQVEIRLKEIEEMGGPRRKKAGESDPRRKEQKKLSMATKKISAQMREAGIALKPEEYLVLWVTVTIVPALFIYLRTGNLLYFLIAGAAGFCILPLWTSQARKKRLDLFASQLGDALMTMSNSLRIGFTFRQAMERIVTDMTDPISGEFKKAVLELSCGASMEKVMEEMSQRMKNHELELVCSALIVQQRVGGNLADIIDNVAATIKDRVRVKRSIRTLTAQGRMSGLVIGLIPVILFVVVNVVNPDYMTPLLTTEYGKTLLAVSLVLEAIGFFSIHKMVDLKF